MNTFKQFFKEKIETSKGYYNIETVVPGENGPKPATGKVFTDGKASARYVLVRFLMGNKLFTDRDDAIDWMRKYLNSSKIDWIEPDLNQPAREETPTQPPEDPKQLKLFPDPDQTYRN